eukprot:scaffold285235_cov19-Tisochrysis_lutea.AAC.1
MVSHNGRKGAGYLDLFSGSNDPQPPRVGAGCPDTCHDRIFTYQSGVLESLIAALPTANDPQPDFDPVPPGARLSCRTVRIT